MLSWCVVLGHARTARRSLFFRELNALCVTRALLPRANALSGASSSDTPYEGSFSGAVSMPYLSLSLCICSVLPLQCLPFPFPSFIFAHALSQIFYPKSTRAFQSAGFWCRAVLQAVGAMGVECVNDCGTTIMNRQPEFDQWTDGLVTKTARYHAYAVI